VFCCGDRRRRAFQPRLHIAMHQVVANQVPARSASGQSRQPAPEHLTRTASASARPWARPDALKRIDLARGTRRSPRSAATRKITMASARPHTASLSSACADQLVAVITESDRNRFPPRRLERPDRRFSAALRVAFRALAVAQTGRLCVRGRHGRGALHRPGTSRGPRLGGRVLCVPAAAESSIGSVAGLLSPARRQPARCAPSGMGTVTYGFEGSIPAAGVSGPSPGAARQQTAGCWRAQPDDSFGRTIVGGAGWRVDRTGRWTANAASPRPLPQPCQDRGRDAACGPQGRRISHRKCT
jgi:hypothetical protein